MLRFWMLLVIVLISLVAVGCSQDEEALPSSSASTQSSTGPASNSGSPTATSITTPDTSTPTVTPTSSEVPAEWQAYVPSDPPGGEPFTLRYPKGWIVKDGAISPVRPPDQLTSVFYSYDPSTVEHAIPSTGLKVDLIIYPPSLGDCRTMPAGAKPASLGGIDGWRLINPETALGGVRAVGVAAYRNGSCYTLTGYFGKDLTSDSLFDDIARSFSFTSPE